MMELVVWECWEFLRNGSCTRRLFDNDLAVAADINPFLQSIDVMTYKLSSDMVDP